MMQFEEDVWYGARTADGSCQINLDGSYLNVFNSADDVVSALDRFVEKYRIEDPVFVVCKTTYQKTVDETGVLVCIKDIIETVGVYHGKGVIA